MPLIKPALLLLTTAFLLMAALDTALNKMTTHDCLAGNADACEQLARKHPAALLSR